MGVHEEEYSIKKVVDHINGDKLDNRIQISECVNIRII